MEELKLLLITLFNDNKNRENGLSILEIFEIIKSHAELVKYSKVDIREVLRLFQQDEYISAHAPTGVPNAEAKYKITGKGEFYFDNLTRAAQLQRKKDKIQEDLNTSVLLTNESVITASGESKKILRWNRNLFWVTLIIAIGTVATPMLAYFNDNEKNNLKQQLKDKDKQLQQLQIHQDSARKIHPAKVDSPNVQ